MQLHFKSYGQGPPLVVLHGLLGSLDNWHALSLKLSEHFRVLAVDQRNHGRSPHHLEMNYRVMAEDVSHLLAQQHLPQANVLGHSMGGKTAMQLALLFPASVERLVVVDIAPRAYSSRHQTILQALLALHLSDYQTRKEIEMALATAIPDLALRQFLLKNLERTPTGHFQWRIGLQEIYRNYRHLRDALLQDKVFTKPALFLRGQYSDYLSEEDLPEIRRCFPHARLETIARSGHLLHVENPDAFLAKVLEFLPRHAPDQEPIH